MRKLVLTASALIFMTIWVCSQNRIYDFQTLASYPIGDMDNEVLFDSSADEETLVPTGLVFNPEGNIIVLYPRGYRYVIDGSTFKIGPRQKYYEKMREIGQFVIPDKLGFLTTNLYFPAYFTWDGKCVFLMHFSFENQPIPSVQGGLYYGGHYFFINEKRQLQGVANPVPLNKQYPQVALSPKETQDLLSSHNPKLKGLEVRPDKSIYVNGKWVSDGVSGFPLIVSGLSYEKDGWLNSGGLVVRRNGVPYKGLAIKIAYDPLVDPVAWTVKSNGDIYFLYYKYENKTFNLARIKNTWAPWQIQAADFQQNGPGIKATLNDSNVRIRAEPSTSSAILGVAQQGDSVTLTKISDLFDDIGDDTAAWFKVKTAKGLEGWIFGKFLTIKQ